MTKMSTSPLPAVNEDPAYARAQQAAGDYTAAASKVRGNQRITDLAKAEQIVSLWENANAAISAAWNDLTDRRRARLTELESLVPVGPGVPADATPADAIVYRQAFKHDLARARELGGDTASLQAMLNDAERFDDDTARRAVLTAAIDSGQVRLVRDWCARAGLGSQLAELIAVRSDLAGHGDMADHLFEQQAFQPIRQPDEATALPGLQRTAEQSKLDTARTANAARKSWN